MGKAISFFFIMFCMCVAGYGQSEPTNVDYKLHEYGASEVLIKEIPNLLEEIDHSDEYFISIEIHPIFLQKYELLLKHPDLAELWKNYLSIKSDKETRDYIETQMLDLISRI